MTSSKVVYIAIEHYRRELDAKILVAMEAARRGYSVVLSSSMALKKSADLLPAGLVMHKSVGGRFASTVFPILERSSHKIMVLDEEGLIFKDKEFYVKNRLDPKVEKYCDLILAWGDYHKSVMQSSGFIADRKIVVVGNPRFDICRLMAKTTTVENGPILVNTRFPTVNGIRTIEENIDNLSVLGVLSCQEDLDYFQSLVKRDVGILEGLMSLVERVAARFPDRTIIVRPHPDEDSTSYVDRFENLKNVHVDKKTQLYDQIASASIVLHEGCTTAIEAAVMGRPVVALVLSPVISESASLPNIFSEQTFSVEEALGRIEEILLSGRGNQEDLPERAQYYLDNVTGEYSYMKIVDCVDRLNLPEASRRDVMAAVRYGRKDVDRLWRVRLAYYLLRQRFGNSKNKYRKRVLDIRIKNEKFPAMSLKEFNGRFRRVSELAGIDPEGITVRQIHGRAFMVYPSSVSS